MKLVGLLVAFVKLLLTCATGQRTVTSQPPLLVGVMTPELFTVQTNFCVDPYWKYGPTGVLAFPCASVRPPAMGTPAWSALRLIVIAYCWRVPTRFSRGAGAGG